MHTDTRTQLKRLPRFVRLAIEVDRINRAWDAAVNELPPVPKATDMEDSALPKWPRGIARLPFQLGPVKQFQGLLSEEELLELSYIELLAHPVLFYELRHLPFQGHARQLWNSVAVFLLRFRAHLPDEVVKFKLPYPQEKPLVDQYNQAVLILNVAQLNYARAVLSIEENWFADLIGRKNTVQLLGKQYEPYTVYSMVHQAVSWDRDWLTSFMPSSAHTFVFSRRDYLRNLLRRELGLTQSAHGSQQQSNASTANPSDARERIAFWWFRWHKEGGPETTIAGYPNILACVDTLIHDIRKTASKADCDDIEWYRHKIASALNGAQPV